MRKLFWLVVFLVVLLVVVDRGGDFAAEKVSADKLQASQQLDRQPDVRIAGIPFLTQFASGKYDHVSADAHDVRVGKTQLRISAVRLDFRDVTTNRDFSRFEAATATAHATIGYADLSRALGATVSYDGSGRVRATKTFTVLGEKLSPVISVQPRVAGQVLTFAGSQLEGADQVPGRVVQALDGIFDTRLSLGDLPFDIKVTSLRVDDQGLQLRLSGKNLSYVAR